MNIPLFTRREFNSHVLKNFDILGILPTDEAYNSYRSFVVNKYCPINPPVQSDSQFVKVQEGTLISNSTKVETCECGEATRVTSVTTSEPAIRLSLAA